MTTSILFLCPHAAAKSVAAVALFSRAAERLGVDADATNAGTDPEPTVNPVVADHLASLGLAVGREPRVVTETDIATADIVINMGCRIADLPSDDSTTWPAIIDWSIPDFSDDSDAAIAAISEETDRLAETIARRQQPIVLIGVGQMGGVFAKAFLAAGHTVVPVGRSDDTAQIASLTPNPALVLVTVGEDDLDAVLSSMPAPWRTCVGLIQNELLPRDWERHGIADPTVAVVWFEKKRGIDTNVVISTPVAGPAAALLVTALERDQIAAHEVTTAEIVDQLIAKNLYILVANIAGLDTGGTVSELWDGHRDLAVAVGDEVLMIQEHLVGRSVDAASMYRGMVAAFEGDPDHGTTGRSAPRRLQRALAHAAEAGLETPNLLAIARTHGVSA